MKIAWLVLSALLVASPVKADLMDKTYQNLPAVMWFQLPAKDRTSIVSAIATASNANFLDIFSCITLFARDANYGADPLQNLIWLCSPTVRP